MLLGLALVAGAVGSVAGAEDPFDLRVCFGPGRTILEGRVDSEATASDLAATLTQARPDLPVNRAGLAIDPTAGRINLPDLRSLLAELGLSTLEGKLEISSDRLLITGLTDSVVTQSAIRLRAAPLLEGRAYHTRLCIVETEALPPIGPSLTSSGPLPAMVAETPAVPEKPFESPGVRFEDLLPTLRMLARIGELSGKPPLHTNAAQPLRAEPMVAATGTAPPVAQVVMPALPTREPLPSIYFSRNSFLLQANQDAAIEAVAKQLFASNRQGLPVQVEAVRAEGGSSAFNDYLCERRVEEVKRILTERGIAATVIKGATIPGTSSVDAGEVKISVELPPPPAPAPSTPPTEAVAPEP